MQSLPSEIIAAVATHCGEIDRIALRRVLRSAPPLRETAAIYEITIMHVQKYSLGKDFTIAAILQNLPIHINKPVHAQLACAVDATAVYAKNLKRFTRKMLDTALAHDAVEIVQTMLSRFPTAKNYMRLFAPRRTLRMYKIVLTQREAMQVDYPEFIHNPNIYHFIEYNSARCIKKLYFDEITEFIFEYAVAHFHYETFTEICSRIDRENPRYSQIAVQNTSALRCLHMLGFAWNADTARAARNVQCWAALAYAVENGCAAHDDVLVLRENAVELEKWQTFITACNADAQVDTNLHNSVFDEFVWADIEIQVRAGKTYSLVFWIAVARLKDYYILQYMPETHVAHVWTVAPDAVALLFPRYVAVYCVIHDKKIPDVARSKKLKHACALAILQNSSCAHNLLQCSVFDTDVLHVVQNSSATELLQHVYALDVKDS